MLSPNAEEVDIHLLSPPAPHLLLVGGWVFVRPAAGLMQASTLKPVQDIYCNKEMR